MKAQTSDARTISAPGSEFMTASKAEASRTTLVTLDLRAAVGIDLVGQEDAAGDVLGKLRLHLGDDLVQRLNTQTVLIVHDHDRIAVRDMMPVVRFGG